MSDFLVFSTFWATPITNFAIVITSIVLLYPLVWRITLKQLSAAVKAMENAKSLPGTIEQMNEASIRLTSVNVELSSLKEKLPDFDELNEKLASMARQVADLRRAAEERPPEPFPNQPEPQVRSDAEHWAEASALWQGVKDRVEAKIEAIYDGRTRRKYASASRYTYDVVADYLRSDGLVSEVQFDALKEIDRMFRSIRNRRTEITPDVLEKFRRLAADFSGGN